MNYQKLLYALGFVAILISASSCRTLTFNDGNKTKPIVTVKGENLFVNDIPGLSTCITREDSVDLIQGYVKYWIDKRVFEHAAQEAMGDKLKGIDKLVDEYRKSLIAQSYERDYVAIVDENVTSEQIKTYYNHNKKNMILSSIIVKAQYIRIPNSYPDQKAIVKKFLSGDNEGLNDLISIADRDDLIVLDYTQDWTEARHVFSNAPFDDKYNIKDFLIRGVPFDRTVGDFRYLLKVKRFALVGDYIPLEMMQESITRSIVFDRKRLKMEEVRKGLSKKAINSGIVIINEDLYNLNIIDSL